MPSLFLVAIFARLLAALGADAVHNVPLGNYFLDTVCHAPHVVDGSTSQDFPGLFGKALTRGLSEDRTHAISMLQKKSHTAGAATEELNHIDHIVNDFPMLSFVEIEKASRAVKEDAGQSLWGAQAVKRVWSNFNNYTAQMSEVLLPQTCRLHDVCRMQKPPSKYLAQAFNSYLQPGGSHVKDHPLPHTDLETIFEKEDADEWLKFTIVFVVLILFDNFVLFRSNHQMTFLLAVLYTSFWISCAFAFLVYIYNTRGSRAAVLWTSGYFLEWMLSVDNLFIFHQIFRMFGTPDDQKHKPLFYGIVGAIFFRLAFFLIEDILIYYVSWMHIVFGLFLVYTGVKTFAFDDDDSEPEENAIVEFIIARIPYINRYDPQGGFFTQVKVDRATGKVVDMLPTQNSNEAEHARSEEGPEGGAGPQYEVKWYATRLVMVLLCLELTDLVFAVDSVSAIVAQIPDLFLSYTACVFAMLGLRAMFFAIDELVKLFTTLKYGVGSILVFLGLKLICQRWMEIPPGVVCFILLSALALSIVASVFIEYLHPSGDNKEKEDSGSMQSQGVQDQRT